MSHAKRRPFPFAPVLLLLVALLLPSLSHPHAVRAGDDIPAAELLKQAQAKFRTGEREAARALLDKAVEQAPEDYTLWMERARVHADMNQAIPAFKDYTQVVKLVGAMVAPNPAAQQAQRDASTQLHTLGRTAGALLDLHASQGAELRELAAGLEAEGRSFSALRLYALALQINPDDTEADEKVRALSAELGRVLAQTALGYGRRVLFDGKSLAGWRVRTGRWDVDQNVLRIRSGGAMYLFLEGPPMEDVVLEAEVRVGTRAHAYIMVRSSYEGAGYAFGVQRSERRNAEGHVIDISWSIQAHRNDSITRTHRILHEASPPRMRIDPGPWYTIRLEARGNTLTGYVNNHKWFEAEDEAFPLGSVGLWGNHASYRNIRLERLPPLPRPTEDAEDEEDGEEGAAGDS